MAAQAALETKQREIQHMKALKGAEAEHMKILANQ